LLLFSGRKDSQFAMVAERVLPKALDVGLGGGVDYYSEFMDSPRFGEPEYQQSYRDFLNRKFKDQPLDLIITVGSLAFELVERNRGSLLAGPPVVFYLTEPHTGRIANSTGLLNEFHFERSLDLALTLQPTTRHVYVVSGAGPADQRYEAIARK